MLTKVLFAILLIPNISTENLDGNTFLNISTRYDGTKFPVKYLVPDDITPTVADFNNYLVSLQKTVSYFGSMPNATDVNVGMGLHLMKAILKRALKDYGAKIHNSQKRDIIVSLINKAKVLLSHYIYKIAKYGWTDVEFRVSKIYTDDAALVYTISAFNRNKLQKWLHKRLNMHEFVEEMDTLDFPKEKYVEHVEFRKNYHIDGRASDLCASRVVYNPEPVHLNEIRPCLPDPYCIKNIYRQPSITYSLSHRLLINYLFLSSRRCYLRSEEDDREHMDRLCAFMYREAVYLARRGYFARDLFMEHVALCALLGYEQFFRRHWFHKVAGWLDEQGCIMENLNFEKNRSAIIIKTKFSDDPKGAEKFRKRRKKIMEDGCHTHPMALFLVFMAHGIRHALHFMKDVIM